MTYVRADRDHFVAGVLDEMRGIPASQILRGHARFEGGPGARPEELVAAAHAA